MSSSIPGLATDAVFVASKPVPKTFREVRGIDYSQPAAFNLTATDLIASMATMGFQGSAVAEACSVIDEMREWRGRTREELIAADEQVQGDFDEEGRQRATVFLGYTSNLISSGMRDTLRFMVQNRQVDAIVATAGGIEEDLIKCLAPTFMGAFALPGKSLRDDGMNRIGNLLVPNDNYCKFEEWIVPVLDTILAEQTAAANATTGDRATVLNPESNVVMTPSKLIARLGKEINDESSVLYWAYKNDIPIYCPALTDGLIGDMLFFHTFKASPQLIVLDIVGDIRKINSQAMAANRSGMLLLGGGLIKHHICNANLMRNGADWAVFINTGQEFDGSDAGARPDEAVSWGKIKSDARMVKVYADVTVVFPLIAAATFAKRNPKDL